MVTINNVNIGAQDVLCMTCDVPPTKRQCSRGADLLTLSEYCINKHLTRVQAQVTCHHQCESIIHTLDVFYWGPSTNDIPPPV